MKGQPPKSSLGTWELIFALGMVLTAFFLTVLAILIGVTG